MSADRSGAAASRMRFESKELRQTLFFFSGQRTWGSRVGRGRASSL